MKWMVASDIHGSAYYCRKLFEAYEREGADQLLLLGDLLYHGPRNDLPEEYAPKKVISMLNENKNNIFCVRGNCEAEVDQMVLQFPVMADYCLIPLENIMIVATHGHIWNENHPIPLKKGDIHMHGHTHVPRCEEIEGILYMNPGSVSIPKNRSWHGYMILNDLSFSWKNLDGKEMMHYCLQKRQDEKSSL